MEYSSMSRTSTMLLCDSANSASPMTVRASWRYPWVIQRIALATRVGVLRIPSRSGSSPISSSSRRMSASYSSRALSVSSILYVVVVSFPEHEPLEPRGGDGRLDQTPEGDDDVLGRGDDPLHEGNIEVEVAVVDEVHHFAFDDPLE